MYHFSTVRYVSHIITISQSAINAEELHRKVVLVAEFRVVNKSRPGLRIAT